MTKDEIIQMADKTQFHVIGERVLSPLIEGSDMLWLLERFAALVAEKEREAIHDEWHSCVMSDLEHGVKCLNEKAAQDWHKNYPAQSKMFPEWLEARAGQ
jgi:hypothetical protein